MPINPEFDLALGDAAKYRDELFADMDQIVVRSAGKSLDAEDQESFDALAAEIERVDQDIANRAAVAKFASRGNTETEEDEGAFQLPRINVNTHGRTEVFDLSTTRGLHGPRLSNELHARAAVAIEDAKFAGITDAAKEAAYRLIENDEAQFDENGDQSKARGERAKHILATGSPQYVEEWQNYMQNPTRGPSDLLRTAMSEASTGVGGAIVPYFLDPTIILTNSGVVSPIRSLATVKQITTNIWHGVTSAGVTAEWIGEATEVSDASPSLSQPTITTYKADAYVQASMELVADTALSGEIAMLLADAKGRLEGTAFATGTGTAQPRGIITACSGVGNLVSGSSGAAGAADLVAADIFALDNAMVPRYRPNASFLASRNALNKVRQLNNGNTPYQSTFWVDFGGGIPSKLIGYPTYEVSDMDTTIVSGSNDDIILLGDVSQYYIIDRIGLELTYNPLVLGSNRRPTGESAWVAFWRTGADMVYSGAAKVLRI